MRLEHHLVGGYVRYISPHIIIIIQYVPKKCHSNYTEQQKKRRDFKSST